MPEHDKPFRAWINQIAYGRYTPPVESTVHYELCNFHAETKIIVRKGIAEYQVRLCSPCQLNSTALVLLLLLFLLIYQVICVGGEIDGKYIPRHLERGWQESLGFNGVLVRLKF